GVKIEKKVVAVKDTSLTLMIWDLAGGDETELPRLSHLRGTHGYIVVVDGCRKWTLESANVIQKKIAEGFGNLPHVVAVNKSDLRDLWEFDATGTLDSDPASVFQTSAKTGDSVERMFETLAIQVL